MPSNRIEPKVPLQGESTERLGLPMVQEELTYLPIRRKVVAAPRSMQVQMGPLIEHLSPGCLGQLIPGWVLCIDRKVFVGTREQDAPSGPCDPQQLASEATPSSYVVRAQCGVAG